ncbi:hypothetical protein [Mariniflexile sp.]|uniref:hypothetical protein n=1 Tax=Mariniflexile sp. TaxID=1979402 RepID=UPI0040485C26
METIIVIGSSIKNGGTHKIASKIPEPTNWGMIDLNDYSFSQFDYDHENINEELILTFCF